MLSPFRSELSFGVVLQNRGSDTRECPELTDAAPRAIMGSAATGPLAAKDLLERYAIEEPRHLVLEGLAADLGVRVVDAELAGAVARLARVGNRGRIRVSRRVTNAGRRRFSIAHEFGQCV